MNCCRHTGVDRRCEVDIGDLTPPGSPTLSQLAESMSPTCKAHVISYLRRLSVLERRAKLLGFDFTKMPSMQKVFTLDLLKTSRARYGDEEPETVEAVAHREPHQIPDAELCESVGSLVQTLQGGVMASLRYAGSAQVGLKNVRVFRCNLATLKEAMSNSRSDCNNDFFEAFTHILLQGRGNGEHHSSDSESYVIILDFEGRQFPTLRELCQRKSLMEFRK